MDLPTSFVGWVIFLLEEYGDLFLRGALVSVYLAVIGTTLGCFIGFIVGVVDTTPTPTDHPIKKALLLLVKLLFKGYVAVFRGTPMMVQAMVIFYGAASILGWNMDPILAAIFIVSINTGAYMAETVRGGILSIDKGQFEGAKAIGMSHFSTMFRVVLPQAFRNIIPQIGNNLVGNIKDTSVLSVIAVNELFYEGRSVTGTYFKYFETFFIICVIYLVMTGIASLLLRLIEKAIEGKKDYKIAEEYLEKTAQERGTPVLSPAMAE